MNRQVVLYVPLYFYCRPYSTVLSSTTRPPPQFLPASLPTPAATTRILGPLQRFGGSDA